VIIMSKQGIILSSLPSGVNSYTRIGSAAKTSNSTITASTWSPITFSTIIENTNANYDGTKYEVLNSQQGMYSISTAVVFTSVTNGNRYIVSIYKNNLLEIILGRGTAGSTNLQGVGGNAKIYLEEGDIIEIRAYCDNTTAAYSTPGYNSFSCYKMP